MKKEYRLSVTTQGPSYPPSEVMDTQGNFIVIGHQNLPGEGGGVEKAWGAAIVSSDTEVPPFGVNLPYKVEKELDLEAIMDERHEELVLCTLPIPLPCNNYPMEFAPEQKRSMDYDRPSLPFHQAHIPDFRPEDGRKLQSPITLRQWIRAEGKLTVTTGEDAGTGIFEFEFKNLIPDSLYTVMSLREKDLNPTEPTRPGPLGIPNVFVTDQNGDATYRAEMPHPFPRGENTNRIVNIVVLWMSTQMSYGGAIGYYGLGGDIHAQLKLREPSFFEFETHAKEKRK